MAIFDENLDYTKLIQFTNGTLQLASFVQIRNALIQRMKDIYGNDIDVSPASADGQYINSLALLFNNILQTIKKGNDSIDPSAATGQYLDTICSYNNIFRIEETNSIAQLYIYNSTGNPIQVNYLSFIDKNNTLWIWDNGGVNITIPASTASKPYYLLTNIICEKLGNISAPGTSTFWRYDTDEQKWVKTNDPMEQSWNILDLYTNFELNGTIYQCIENNGLYVYQYKDAEVGEKTETDEALRSRRYQMLGNNSVTVLESLKGNLLNIIGIEDVFVFNNQASGDGSVSLTPANGFVPIADNTSLKGHSIYIAIRYKEGVVIDPKDIGSVIYNKLTPGISTSPITSGTTTGGTQESFEIVRTSNFSDFIYWKKCSSINPGITLEFQTNPKIYDYPTDFAIGDTLESHQASNDFEKRIVQKLQEYINKIKINDYLTIPNLLMILQQADIQKEGMPTFFASSGDINNDSLYPANLSYFKYDDTDYIFEYDIDPDTNLPTGGAILYIGV